MTVDHNGRLERYADSAAGASEGQAEPVGDIWEYSFIHSSATGRGETKIGPCLTYSKSQAFGVGCIEQRQIHPSAEIAALRERIAELESFYSVANDRIEELERDIAAYREAGVWEPDGKKFMTYRNENLNGKAMYVKEPKQ